MNMPTFRLIVLLSLPVFGMAFAAPFGDKADVDYANNLWSSLIETNLVGDQSTIGKVYIGTEPHGAILDTLQSTVTVGSDTGAVIVKKNFRGDDITLSLVADDPLSYLESITVMFKRHGYDPEDKDWFWAKYTPAGELMKNPKDMALAGMVAKGNNSTGCIACHKAAPGGDFVFINDRYR